MAKYDIESLLVDVLAIMTTYLNAKIGEINTEKSDSITLKTVSSGAYFLQTMDAQAANLDPYILYSVENIETTGIGPSNGNRIDISVVLCLSDMQDVNVAKRMFRYSRALSEIFTEHFQENEQGLKITVQSLVPVSFKALNSSFRSKAVGVLLSTFLTS